MVEKAVNYLLQKLAPFFESEVNLLTWVGKQDTEHQKDRLELIRTFLRDPDELEDSDDELKIWAKQVRDVVHKTEDLLDELELLQTHNHSDGFSVSFSKISCCIRNMKARYRISSELKDMDCRMRNILSDRQRFLSRFEAASRTSNSISTVNTWHDQRGDALLLDSNDLVGIDRQKGQFIEWLFKGCSSRGVISVTGMGGLGKTTLVKKVYDDPEIKRHFKTCVWITVSQSSSTEELLKDTVKKLFHDISRPVPEGLESMRNDQLKVIINKLLKRRRYLVVFDDMWHMYEWEAVKYAFPNNTCGSRVMITTRKTDLASLSSIESKGKVYNMQRLSEDEAWDLFCRKTFPDHSCPSYLMSICKSILRKCEGLPLAIVAVSGVLATKDRRAIDEWDMICRSLGAEIQGNDKLDNLKKVLGLSFSDLPSQLKQCILYLSIFPEAYLIKRMRLIRLWIAEGFIEAKEGRTLEEVAEDYLKELLNRNLIQVAKTTSDGRVKTIRIHALLREILILKSKHQNFAAIVKEKSAAWPEKTRRLSLHSTLPNGLIQRSVSQLRSLFMFGVAEKISLHKLFPGGFRLLNVLDFEKAPLKKFPVQMTDLYHLKYLSLRKTKVKIIPSSIGKLQNLETLDVKYSSVTELPADITKLRKLRHLLVYHHHAKVRSFVKFHSKCGFKAIHDIGNLQSLQKLCFIEVDQCCRTIIKQLGGLTQLRRLGIMKLREEDGRVFCSSIERLTNLRALSITSEGEDKIVDLRFLSSPHPFLQRLYLSGHMHELPKWIPSLHSLIKLILKWSNLKHDPLVYLQDLPNLAHLELLQVYDGDTLCFKSGKFKKLKVLGLDKFDELRQVNVEQSAMPCLEKLIIQRCELLKNVPSGMQHLTKLKVLEFFDMPDELITTLYPDDRGEDYWKVAHIPEVYFTYWRDGGWDVYALESFRESSPRSGLVMRSHEHRNLWKG
ncbi:disease resistance protein RPM1-like [Prosopis cineraria]|uniref:disease resistance protein RPM1-like n=1 Tax=Prosopis cineraria TaxID=364024 RepID=UPI0024102063|nr:disease resistance protein RPM1-like [Prosopis cineraria]